MGDVSRVLIVIQNANVVPISAWGEEGGKLGLKKMLERGVLKVCGTLKGNTRQGTGGLVGGNLWKCEISCSLVRGDRRRYVGYADPSVTSRRWR